ncbi:MAG: hypothetical protein FJ025_00480 [Chloroflexi bacterium]|nr:hypothetical protein [Chloroflexota bacterium]
MRRHSTILIFAAIFLSISGLTYLLHYYVFKDIHHISIFLLGDLAFLPIEVFLVVIVIERILARREKQAVMQKLNMVVGAFFSEVGNQLLRRLLVGFAKNEEIRKNLAVGQDWSHADFKAAMAFAHAIEETPSCLNLSLEELKTFLVQKRSFLLRLLENPNLLEHERFTNLLWATFHLTEELEARTSMSGLPDTDLQHINVDIQRVYRHLAAEWVSYIEHLQLNYPFLFSLVVRTHPFHEQPSPVVV